MCISLTGRSQTFAYSPVEGRFSIDDLLNASMPAFCHPNIGPIWVTPFENNASF